MSQRYAICRQGNGQREKRCQIQMTIQTSPEEIVAVRSGWEMGGMRS